MAKVQSSIFGHVVNKVRRPGVHAKSKTSHLKSSKNYKKPYVGQGRV
jgi:hypothetical protein